MKHFIYGALVGIFFIAVVVVGILAPVIGMIIYGIY